MGFVDRMENSAFVGRVEMTLAKYCDAKRKGDDRRMERATREMRETLEKYSSHAHEAFGWPDEPVWLDVLMAREAFTKEVGDHLKRRLGHTPKAVDVNLACVAITKSGSGSESATFAVPKPDGSLTDVTASDVIEHWELGEIVARRRSREAYPFDGPVRARLLAAAASGACDIIGLIRV